MIPNSMSVGAAVEDLLVLDGGAVEADRAGGVIHIPLR